MELAIAVLGWTAAACAALMTLMGTAYIGAKTELVRAQAASERRLH